MKLVYAPSAKRMIPYPPVGLAVLAGALRDTGHSDLQLIDLEMCLWGENNHSPILLWRRQLSTAEVLAPELDVQTSDYAELLYKHSRLQPDEPLGISVMGFEQLASALLLARTALRAGSNVIMGGQFWSRVSATDILTKLSSERLTITVGDGWDAIKQWCRDPCSDVANSYRLRGAAIATPGAITKTSDPPRPDFTRYEWEQYESYGSRVYGDVMPTRRAHLYVWDKLCPYRCNFCRVSSGSLAKLSPTHNVIASLTDLLDLGVTQLNFMTNELNPSLRYMKDLANAMKAPLASHAKRISWFTYLRPDAMGRDDLYTLRDLGCRLLRMGVETGSQRLSDLMQKDYHIETIERVLEHASDVGIANHVNFIVGYPGETQRDHEDTLAFVERNARHVHSVRLNPFYLPPDTPLSREPQKFGLRLIEFKGGYWQYDAPDAGISSDETIKHRLVELEDKLKLHDIGFAGVVPFLMLDALSKDTGRDEALVRLRRERPYLWQHASADRLKSILGGYEEQTNWESTINKRGRNYSLRVCDD